MTIQNPIFEVLKAFCPQPKTYDAQSMKVHFIGLRKMRYDIYNHALEIHDKGITVIAYLPHKTNCDTLKWSDIFTLIDSQFAELKDWQKQLAIAF